MLELRVEEDPAIEVTVAEDPVIELAQVGTVIKPPTYSGAYSVTPSEAAQSLQTTDKLLTDNISIDAIPSNYKDVTIVTATANDVRSGKKIVGANGEITGAYLYDGMGDVATLVDVVYSKRGVALESTSYNGWTPSTTAKTIHSAVTLSDQPTLDMVNYEYLLKWIFTFNPVYASGTTLKAAVDKTVMHIYQAIYRRPNTLSAIASKTNSHNIAATYMTPALMEYYNTSGAMAFNFAASYGVYVAATAPAFSSTTASSPTLTIKTPAVSARCSTTYFSTAMAAAIDQAKSKYWLQGELYRVRKRCPSGQLYDGVIDTFNET